MPVYTLDYHLAIEIVQKHLLMYIVYSLMHC